MFSTRNLIVIVTSLYLILYVLKDNQYKMIVGGGAFLFLCMNNGIIEGLEDGASDGGSDGGFTGEKDDSGSSIVGNNTVSGSGAKAGVQGDPKILNMGPYDGICLKTGNQEY